jgi:hypothetical protein
MNGINFVFISKEGSAAYYEGRFKNVQTTTSYSIFIFFTVLIHIVKMTSTSSQSSSAL